MEFVADFHIHSKYSRATAKTLDFEHLHAAAQLKGITVLGTGDFTHPGWFQEIQQKLVPAEPGLFRLDGRYVDGDGLQVPPTCHAEVRFMLVAEISNIYKKNGKTRKNHNLIFVPDIVAAQKVIQRLKAIGNIESDGRPILGLDAKNLLQIVLDIHDEAFLIPAHIWTPWFSLLGSKSGFDSIGECFEELTPQIFALETGLSSDPAMNWRFSDLDGRTLVSNSDAHSPQKVGREANIFNTELSYKSIRKALKTGDPKQFKGTFEFFPEEGKYHLDGHRKCDIRFWPEQSLAVDCTCPVCGKPLTLGVLHRVEKLANRPQGQKPVRHHPYYKLIPLQEIIADILGVGPNSKRVQTNYRQLLHEFGSEYAILHTIDWQVFQQQGYILLGEAIKRVRSGLVDMQPGFDGQFGKIRLFDTQERERFKGQKSLFQSDSDRSVTGTRTRAIEANSASHMSGTDPAATIAVPSETAPQSPLPPPSAHLNQEQRRAVEHDRGPLLIVAGPGTGKTRTLTHRVAHLIGKHRIDPEKIVAVTFTNKAAEEMRLRLKTLLKNTVSPPMVTTFHGFCYQLLSQWKWLENRRILNENDQKFLVQRALRLQTQQPVSKKGVGEIHKQIVVAKQNAMPPDRLIDTISPTANARMVAEAYRVYQQLLDGQRALDFEDLIFKVVHRFELDKALRKAYQNRFQHILIDEYQDLNFGQYRLVKLLTTPDSNLFVIGDPEQAIYGFRGSDAVYFERFKTDYPGAAVIELKKNYRSTQTILDASYQLLAGEKDPPRPSPKVYSDIHGTPYIDVIESASEKAEAVVIGQQIEQLVGGIGMHSIDFGKVDDGDLDQAYGFADMAVLFRTRRQIDPVVRCFMRAGIPFQVSDKDVMLNHTGIREVVSWLKVATRNGSLNDVQKVWATAGFKPNRRTLDRFIDGAVARRLSVSQAIKQAQTTPPTGLAATQRRRLTRFLDLISGGTIFDPNAPVGEILQRLYVYLEKNLELSITEREGFRQRVAFLMKLARRYGRQTEAFFSALALQSDTDLYDPRAEAVSLMTMHAAKGLEFPVVFICGCEDGLIPLRRADDSEIDLPEERRLLYVAMTRAKDRLYVSFAKNRSHSGRRVNPKPSPFLDAIAPGLKHVRQSGICFQDSKPIPKQLELF